MIISSQRYISSEILNEKIDALESSRPSEIVLETWTVGIDNMEVLFNGHHTLEAARQLEIPVRFVSTAHPEGLTGDNLLEQSWMDNDWYDIETGQLAF